MSETSFGPQYRVLAKLGEGGMGQVYLVERTDSGRREALKVLRPGFASEPAFAARFRREVRALTRLRHPNIVGLHDVGVLPDGRCFFTLEYAEGERLDDVLRRAGRLPVDRALSILLQLADAVGHAHAAHVIHRDLKPANLILVEERGQADVLKVLDFGLAKFLAPEGPESVRTQSGAVFGTPEYMSPEQCVGQGADERSDVYAMGCVAYELLTGEPPFESPMQVEVMRQHMTKVPVPPSARRAAEPVAGAVDAIVLRCLDKDPARRFQTGGELVRALEGAGAVRGVRIAPGARERDTVPETRGYPDDAGRERAEARRILQRILREAGEALVELGERSLVLHGGLETVRAAEARLAGLRDEREARGAGVPLDAQVALAARIAGETANLDRSYEEFGRLLDDLLTPARVQGVPRLQRLADAIRVARKHLRSAEAKVP